MFLGENLPVFGPFFLCLHYVKLLMLAADYFCLKRCHSNSLGRLELQRLKQFFFSLLLHLIHIDWGLCQVFGYKFAMNTLGRHDLPGWRLFILFLGDAACWLVLDSLLVLVGSRVESSLVRLLVRGRPSLAYGVLAWERILKSDGLLLRII